MSKICCFTGHRDIPLSDYEKVMTSLKTTVSSLIDEGYTVFRAGGAMGFDSIAALCILDFKAENPDIKLHLILPCKNQDKYFSAPEKRAYQFAIDRADDVIYMQNKYSNGVMQIRNRALVDGADICVAYITRLTGGTYQTVNMARRAGLKVINVAKK